MKAQDPETLKRTHLANFNIAGFSYWDGCEAFGQLQIGTEFKLVRETGNAFDFYAVAIYFGDFKLGYVPREENHEISKYLDMGLENIYECRVTRLTPDTHPENQVAVIVYVKNQKLQ